MVLSNYFSSVNLSVCIHQPFWEGGGGQRAGGACPHTSHEYQPSRAHFLLSVMLCWLPVKHSTVNPADYTRSNQTFNILKNTKY